MRKLLALITLMLGLAVAPGVAQHPRGTVSQEMTEEPPSTDTGGTMEWWKWANFALLAAGIGWIAKKNAGPFFSSRSREIRRQLVEAEEIRAEALRRIKEVEARLGNLASEIEELRAEARAEQQAEAARFRAEAAAEMAKIEAHALEEIEAAGKHASLELKRHAATLALEAAEGKIRARMTPSVQQGLVDSFVRELEAPSSRAQGI